MIEDITLYFLDNGLYILFSLVTVLTIIVGIGIWGNRKIEKLVMPILGPSFAVMVILALPVLIISTTLRDKDGNLIMSISYQSEVKVYYHDYVDSNVKDLDGVPVKALKTTLYIVNCSSKGKDVLPSKCWKILKGKSVAELVSLSELQNQTVASKSN